MSNRYALDDDNNTNKMKKRGGKLIRDERLRKINAVATGEKFLTNVELDALGEKLVEHARHCNTEEALKLLEGDIDPDRKDSDHFFWTSAHWACRHNDIRLLRALYKKGANLEIPDRPDSWLPVHVAAKFDSKECLHFLAEEAGVNMHAKSDDGMTPFHWTCGQGHLGAAIMIANLADKEWEERQLAMDIADRAMRVHLEKLPKLDVNSSDGTGVSPLHEASAGGHIEVVRWLSEARNTDVSKKDYMGANCLDFARRRKGLGELQSKLTTDERKLLTKGENDLEAYLIAALAESDAKKQAEKNALRQKILDAERARRKELGLEMEDDDAVVDLETGEVVSKKELAARAREEEEAAELKRIEEEGAETAEELFTKLGVTDKELLKFQNIYEKIDDDGSEEITANELFDYLGMEATPFAIRVFSLMDDSGDNAVDFEEFCAMLTLFCSISKDSLVSFAFSLYDTDGSQTLDREELRNMMQEVYGTKWEKSQRTRDVLDKMDEDGDGNCDIGEFEEACKSYARLLKPAFDMQNVLRDKTLGQSTWNKINKKQQEHFGKDIKSMMNKITGREALIAERALENKIAARMNEEDAEKNAKEDRKKNMELNKAMAASGQLGHDAP